MHQEIKNKIIQWCKDDNLSCVDLSKKNPHAFWVLAIGNPSIIVNQTEKFADRIYFSSVIGIASQHRKLIETWTAEKKGNLTKNLSLQAVQFDVNLSFDVKDNQITGIRQFMIHFDSKIEKGEFLKLVFRLQPIHNITLNSLNVALGLELNQLQQQEKASSENPLSG